MGLIGIFLSLGLLMYLAYRGINVLILAPVMALLATLFAGWLPLLATYTQVFMPALGNYLLQFFPLFLLGAIFGKLMADSGSARTIAEWFTDKMGASQSIAAVVAACGVLTYGGVSLFVVAFAVYPIANALFQKSDTPKRLLPAALALGSFTFTMTAFPGTPAIQNAIPMPYFGTTPFAAPIYGTLAGLGMLIGGTFWLNRRRDAANAKGEGYGDHPATDADANEPDDAAPGFLIAILPVVAVIVLNAAFTYLIIPAMETGYLADDQYGNASIDDVKGIWAIIASLVIAILLCTALNWSRFKDLLESYNKGTMGSLLPVFNTASEVGYGAVIASLPAFVVVRDAVLGLSSNPLISSAVATNVLAGITGSASGGMSIALETLGDRFAEQAQAAGIDPEIMHRVVALSSGGFDALPHNGAVITLLAITGLTHKTSYGDIFVVAVLIPFSITVAVVLSASVLLV
ncbi:Citrate transporter [Rhodobacteraceae bacterium THAF1]|uniref:GntP family permease n=1 Tax=Palleronia sp. THAF1 TaxID=2587842 RepID=UPI000F3C0D1D|nr:GntP family permease [Palleronia sp. THAF1]QFU08022.1 Citrate transporter [Palleronia sp. THAF1]VDC27875.1 Citrate transporter [Rhodobacteraceae bacterium THAF1]